MTRPLNPFNPSRPIDPLKFVGRGREIRDLEASLAHAIRDRPRHFLITGERGVGKTSFLDFIRRRATIDGDFNFAVVDFAVNSDTKKLDFARALKAQLDDVLAAHSTYRESLEQIWGFIRRFEAAGFSYREDRSDPENHRDLYQELSESLCEIVKRTCGTAASGDAQIRTDGILLLVDEVDRSSPELDLGAFFKYLLESLNRKGCHRVVVGLAGLSTCTDVLLASHQSSLRIFDELPLANLPRRDVEELLDEVQILVRDDALAEFQITPAARQLLYELSGGHPHMLHQFGYCAFEAVCNGAPGELRIDVNHVMAGAFELRGALDLIGDMYFRKPFEAVRHSAPALEVVDQMSEANEALSIEQVMAIVGHSESEVAAAMDALIESELVETVEPDKYKIRHAAFSYWVKTQRPQRV